MILPIHLSHASSNSFSSSSSCSFGVSFFRRSFFSSSASRRSRARSACVLRFASVIRANVVSLGEVSDGGAEHSVSSESRTPWRVSWGAWVMLVFRLRKLTFAYAYA